MMADASSPLSGYGLATGVFTIVSALAVGIGGVFILTSLMDTMQDHGVMMNDATLFIFEYRTWLPIVVLPAVVLAAIGLIAPRHRWAFVALGSLLLVPVMVALVYAVVMSIAPLYEYQSL